MRLAGPASEDAFPICGFVIQEPLVDMTGHTCARQPSRGTSDERPLIANPYLAPEAGLLCIV